MKLQEHDYFKICYEAIKEIDEENKHIFSFEELTELMNELYYLLTLGEIEEIDNFIYQNESYLKERNNYLFQLLNERKEQLKWKNYTIKNK